MKTNYGLHWNQPWCLHSHWNLLLTLTRAKQVAKLDKWMSSFFTSFFDWQLSLFKTWSVWIKRRTVQLNEKLDKEENSPVQRKPLPKNAKQNCRPVEVLFSSSLYYPLSQCSSDFKSLIEEWGLLEREGLFHVKAPGNSFVTLEWYYWKQKHALLMLKSL